MAESDLERGFNSVMVGITQEELEAMSDTNLALWQAENNKPQAREHLAKYEWQRRIAERQMAARFALDQKLASGNRWTALGCAIIGAAVALAGVFIGHELKTNTQATLAAQQPAPKIAPPPPSSEGVEPLRIAPAESPKSAPVPTAPGQPAQGSR